MNTEEAASLSLEKSLNTYMPFLVEIRKRLFFVAALFITATLIGFIYYEKIIKLILSLFYLEGVNIVFTSPFQFINLAISAGMLVGLLFTFPLIIYQIITFLKPALNKKEFRTIINLLPISVVLFLAGIGFGIYIMRYVVLIFYERSTGLNVGNFLDISLLLSQIFITAILLGIAFQFPIVLTILMRFKLLKYKSLVKQRLLVYGLSLIFAALLPPTDLLSLVLMAIPLIVLFEVTLLLNKWVLKAHLL